MNICIDAGHTKGANLSPCGYGYSEGTRMFEYSHILGEELAKYKDVNITYTRKKITDNPDLKERSQIAEGSDLLLSLHTNATGSTVNNGTDYAVVFRSISDTGVDFSTRMAKAIAATMETTQRAQSLTKRNSEGNADYYGIIRHAQALGVRCLLLEHSFHTDCSMTRWLMNDANLRKLAIAEAEVIAEEYRLVKEVFEMRYQTLADLKSDEEFGGAYLPTVEKLIKKGYIKGKGGSGDDLILDLSEDSVRILVILDRAGNFDN